MATVISQTSLPAGVLRDVHIALLRSVNLVPVEHVGKFHLRSADDVGEIATTDVWPEADFAALLLHYELSQYTDEPTIQSLLEQLKANDGVDWKGVVQIILQDLPSDVTHLDFLGSSRELAKWDFAHIGIAVRITRARVYEIDVPTNFFSKLDRLADAAASLKDLDEESAAPEHTGRALAELAVIHGMDTSLAAEALYGDRLAASISVAGTPALVDGLGIYLGKWLRAATNAGPAPESSARITIDMNGGLIHDIQSDGQVEVLIIDNDLDGVDEDDKSTLVDANGKTREAYVSRYFATMSPEPVAALYAMAEATKSRRGLSGTR